MLRNVPDTNPIKRNNSKFISSNLILGMSCSAPNSALLNMSFILEASNFRYITFRNQNKNPQEIIKIKETHFFFIDVNLQLFFTNKYKKGIIAKEKTNSNKGTV